MKKLSLIVLSALTVIITSCVSPEPNKDRYEYDNVAYVSTYDSDGKTYLIFYPKDGVALINNFTDEITFIDKDGKEVKLDGSYSVSFE